MTESNKTDELFYSLIPLDESDLKIKELFKDMDNMKKEAEPFIAFARKQGPEYERTAKMVFGLLENEAAVTRDVPGIGVIDGSIADIIQLLNDTGHETLASCSGVRTDHDSNWEKKNGYISFSDTIENRSLAVNIADIDRYTPKRGYTYLKQSFTLHFDEEQLPELICKLKKLCDTK